MVESTTTHCFQVAGLKFSVELPCALAVGQLLPSFAPFKADAEGGDCLFGLSVADCDTKPERLTLIEESDNDMGHLRLFASPAGYRVEIVNDGCTHSMNADRLFSRIEAHIDHDDRHAGNALSSMLRIAFAQAALRLDAVSIHASVVACDGRACLFMGKSGTGKSTHSALWLRHIPGTELLNDDNPAIRIVGGRAYAYGTPWSGKTPCYKNLSLPVAGMARLRQASANNFYRLEGADAFVAIYPGCSVILQDPHLRNLLYNTLTRLAEIIPVVGRLDCLPDREAAILCHRAMLQEAHAAKHETITTINHI